MPDVAVIDYGVGNLLSVSRAFAQCGADVVVSSDSQTILSAKRAVLPGVGAFANVMSALVTRGMDSVVHQFVATGKPLLGICVGMQMLMDTSEEFGETQGLGLIPGRVIRIPNADVLGRPLKVPHIGWNELRFADYSSGTDRSIFSRVQEGDSVYFIHSFMAKPTHHAHMAAHCMVGGHKVCAAVRKGNVFGSQFHPEKSGKVGLTILQEYLSLECGD